MSNRLRWIKVTSGIGTVIAVFGLVLGIQNFRGVDVRQTPREEDQTQGTKTRVTDAVQLPKHQSSGKPLALGVSRVTPEDRRLAMKQKLESLITHSSSAEAGRELEYALRVPSVKSVALKNTSNSVIGRLSDIYVDAAQDAVGKQSRHSYMYYVNEASFKQISEGFNPRQGISIEAYKPVESFDYAAWIKQIKDGMRTGTTLSDVAPFEINVNGAQGMAIKPGYNVSASSKEPRVGFVQWNDNGVEYVIYGSEGPDGTSVETLLEIARSMQ